MCRRGRVCRRGREGVGEGECVEREGVCRIGRECVG